MATKKDEGSSSEVQASQEDTSRQYAGTADPSQPTTPRMLAEQQLASTAKNPVDFGAEVKVDDLPPVPPAGMFMPPDQSMEDTAPGPEASSGNSGKG